MIEGHELPKDLEKIPENFDKSIVITYLSEQWMYPLLQEFFQSPKVTSETVSTPSLLTTTTSRSYLPSILQTSNPEHSNLILIWNQLRVSLREVYRLLYISLSNEFQKIPLDQGTLSELKSSRTDEKIGFSPVSYYLQFK